MIESPYLWLKAFHIIAVISWMAGLLYLPRLYVYHAESEVGSEKSETFKTMERRLLRYITTPAMIISLILGVALLSHIMPMSGQGWFHAKALLLVGMFAFHGMCAKWMKDFAKDQNTKSPKFFRIANEVPTTLMIFIVLLAIIKPF